MLRGDRESARRGKMGRRSALSVGSAEAGEKNQIETNEEVLLEFRSFAGLGMRKRFMMTLFNISLFNT